MSERIDISIELNGQQLDFSIPTEITMGRFNELMHQVLKGGVMPKSWTLKLKDKNIKVDDTDLIKELPIGSGDVFCIIPTPERQENLNENI